MIRMMMGVVVGLLVCGLAGCGGIKQASDKEIKTDIPEGKIVTEAPGTSVTAGSEVEIERTVWDIEGEWYGKLVSGDTAYDIYLTMSNVRENEMYIDVYMPQTTYWGTIKHSATINFSISETDIYGKRISCIFFSVSGEYPEKLVFCVYEDAVVCRYINHDAVELYRQPVEAQDPKTLEEIGEYTGVEILVEKYLNAFGSGDENAIADLILPEFKEFSIQLLATVGAPEDTLLMWLDYEHYEKYGNKVSSWTVSDIYESDILSEWDFFDKIYDEFGVKLNMNTSLVQYMLRIDILGNMSGGGEERFVLQVMKYSDQWHLVPMYWL